ncbi:YfeK family protein [Atlantibacter sp. RC6]|uniref:YfeK family protein n=1 Tax=Atlantibacter sp. RC6 TaxID=2587036 RepID=UPI001605EC3A|nr:YfeK family protein [Atlantibacter sp. RC6]MBB3321537.1 hypothetical protein [Atlantibacter sp. RC6]
MKKKGIIIFLCTLLAAPAFAKLSSHEEARIEALLTALRQEKDLTFIRNGSAHNSEEAASHLQLKLSKTRNRLDTAEQFIDNVASTSSISGQPYTVKIDGKEQKAQVYLHQLIEQTDKTVK